MNGARSIGHLVIDEIHLQRMITAKFDGHGYIYTWAGSAAEQLEALVEQHYIRKPTPDQMETVAHNIIAALESKDHLSQLSHRALIDVVLNTDAADFDAVIELCNRVLPGWEK